MRYRIVVNGAGKFKVQSSPMSHSSWASFRNFFKPLVWHNRGDVVYVDYTSLNWGGTEFETREAARECMVKCRDYAAKEHTWRLEVL